MEILVCIKQVPDTTEIRIDPETNTLIRTGVPSIMNPFDAYAVEQALQLKEMTDGRVTVVTMGPPQAKSILGDALAMGVDDAYLVTDRKFGGSDTLATSYILASVARKLGPFDVILCGKQAIDGDTGQVGPEMAEHLDIPQITYVSSVEVDGKGVKAVRECTKHQEIVTAQLPVMGGGGSLVRNIAVGVIGSCVGGLLFGLLGFSAHSLFANIIVSVVGACVFLFVARRLTK